MNRDDLADIVATLVMAVILGTIYLIIGYLAFQLGGQQAVNAFILGAIGAIVAIVIHQS